QLQDPERPHDGYEATLEALAMAADPVAVPAVAAFLHGELARMGAGEQPSPVRREAIATLAVLRATEHRSLVLEAFERGDVYDQRIAAVAIGILGAASDLPTIERRLAKVQYPRGAATMTMLLLAPERATKEDASALVAAAAEWDRSSYTLALFVGLTALAERFASGAPADLARILADGCIDIARATFARTRPRLVHRVDAGLWKPSKTRALITFARRLEVQWSAVREHL
ncbi:MAG TPA: hypothetical protein VM580_32050, partial [Labilithrix sp.]|nr:hypothetical protein [Labilithrix sp.]